MPRPLDGLQSSASQFYQNQDQCALPPDSKGIANPSVESPATSSALETCPLAPAADAHAGLLEKYATDLSAFRRTHQATNDLNKAEPSPAEPNQAAPNHAEPNGPPTVILHDPVACNESVRAAVLDCLDAAANLCFGLEAATSGGSIGDVGTGIQMATSSMRCSDRIEEAYDACTDQVVP